jgi:surface polysaccharide O-acyltransferase-like enzyme
MSDRLPHLDALRGLAIILVVGIHARGYAYTGATGAAAEAPAGRAWAALTAAAVPAFFLCDGFLFARGQARPGRFDSAAYLRKSARRLLLPWLLFSLLYAALRAALEAGGLFRARLVLGRPPAEVAANLLESRVAMQMYFLPALFLIRALAPVTRHLARAPGWAAAPACAAYVALRHALAPPLGGDPVTNALGGLQYYLLGIVVFRYDALIAQAGWPPFALLAALAAAAPGAPGAAGSGPLHLASQGATLLAAYAACRAPARPAGPLTALGRHTMGIYLLHAPVLLKVVYLAVARLVPAPAAAFPIT